MKIRHVLPVLLLLMATAAFAQTASSTGTYEVSPDDPALQILMSLFQGTGKYAMALQAAMGAFNKGVLLFATLLFTWMALVGILNTARDGKALGKNWSSMWIPLRFGLAAALLVPSPTTGLSVGQGIILYSATQGIGIANDVWGSAVTAFATATNQTSAGSANAAQTAQSMMGNPVFSANLDSLVRQILAKEECAARQRFNHSVDASTLGIQVPVTLASLDSDDPTSTPYLVAVGTSEAAPLPPPSDDDNAMVIRWGWTPGATSQGPSDLCGYVQTASWSTSSTPNVFSIPGASNGPATIGGLVSSASGSGAPTSGQATALQGLIAAQVKAIRDVAGLASQSGQGGRSAAEILTQPCGGTNADGSQQAGCLAPADRLALENGFIEAAKETYARDMAVGISSALAASASNNATTGSWIYAAASFYGLAHGSGDVIKLANTVPSVVNPDPSYFAAPGQEATWTQSFGDSAGKSWASLRSLWNQPVLKLTQWASYKLAGDPTSDKHFLAQMKDTGDWLVGSTETLLVTAWAAGKAANAASDSLVGKAVKAVGAGGLLSGLSDAIGALTWSLMALFLLGVTLSMLPMLPVLIWAGAVIGWLIAVIEAVLAAPLWIASHMTPDGDGFASQRSLTGYLILLEVVMRPAIMVLGLLSSLWIMDVAMRFSAVLFWSAANNMQGSSTTGIPTMLMLIGLYVVMCLTVVRQTANLCVTIPGNIARWFGGVNATHDRGEAFGAEVASHATSVQNAAGLGLKGGVGIAAAAWKSSGDSKAVAAREMSERVAQGKDAKAKKEVNP